jgi:predicted dehydrogenase
MKDDFRVGIVGAVSAYSLILADALVKDPDVSFGGLAYLGRGAKYIRDAWGLPYLTQYPQTLDAYAEKYEAEIYEQPEDMIEAEALDAVCITTEDYLHVHHALRALDKGAHVFLPKPFVSRHEDAARIFKAANERGLIAVGSLPLRFSPLYVKARELIDEGVIGRPLNGRFVIEHHLTLGGWKSDPSMAAGPEYEMGFYTFDAMRWLMGSEPKRVMAYGANLDHRGIPWIDNAVCITEFENGAMASADLRFSMHHRFVGHGGLEIVGDEAALTFEKDPETGESVVAVYDASGTTHYPVPPRSNYKGKEMLRWVAMCRKGEDPTSWQEECLRSLDFITAFKCAHESDQAVTLPLNTEDCGGDQ